MGRGVSHERERRSDELSSSDDEKEGLIIIEDAEDTSVIVESPPSVCAVADLGGEEDGELEATE